MAMKYSVRCYSNAADAEQRGPAKFTSSFHLGQQLAKAKSKRRGVEVCCVAVRGMHRGQMVDMRPIRCAWHDGVDRGTF
jgi:hypothetical protein